MSIELNRSAFEAFAQRNEFGTYRTDRKGDGYDSSHTQLMWMAWCAAIQQPATTEPVLYIHPSTFEMNNAHVGAWKPGHELPGYIPLFTHPAPGVPDGYVLVPVTPTPEMENAFRQAFTDQLHKRRNQWGREKHTMSAEGAGLRAMLAAAPKEGGAA